MADGDYIERAVMNARLNHPYYRTAAELEASADAWDAGD